MFKRLRSAIHGALHGFKMGWHAADVRRHVADARKEMGKLTAAFVNNDFFNIKEPLDNADIAVDITAVKGGVASEICDSVHRPHNSKIVSKLIKNNEILRRTVEDLTDPPIK